MPQRNRRCDPRVEVTRVNRDGSYDGCLTCPFVECPSATDRTRGESWVVMTFGAGRRIGHGPRQTIKQILEEAMRFGKQLAIWKKERCTY